MDHTPPPFFKRGPAPLVRLFFFASLSLALLVIDARFRYAEGLRSWLALAAYPVQRAATTPVELVGAIGSFFSTQAQLVAENERLRAKALTYSQHAQRYEAAYAEAEQLRSLPEEEYPNVSGHAGELSGLRISSFQADPAGSALLLAESASLQLAAA